MFGCVCPHPPLLIPEVGGESIARVSATAEAMRQLVEIVGEPETIVVISPHSEGYGDAHVVRTAERLHGDFAGFRHPEVSFSYENDVPFAELLLALAGDRRELQMLPDGNDTLDWGVTVPLSFFKVQKIVSLSIVNDYQVHRSLGQLVRRCAAELHRDVLFLASGDLSHALTHDAPAAYDPRGKLFDDAVARALAVGDFTSLAEMDPVLLEGAAECGYRSILALGGFLGQDASLEPRLLSYEAPFGVGYLVACFSGERQGRRS